MRNLKELETTVFWIEGRKGNLTVTKKGKRKFTERSDYAGYYKHKTEHGSEILLCDYEFNKLCHDSIIPERAYATGQIYITEDRLADKDKLIDRAKEELLDKARQEFGSW